MNFAKTVKDIKKSSFYKRCEDNRYVLLSFFTAIGVCLLIAFCYDMVPFGDITILRMDLYHQYGPLFAELYDRIKGGGSLLYSWVSGGGGSFLGNFLNYLSSPLSVLVLLFKRIDITDAIAFIIMLKGSLSAATFTYYLKASPEFKKHSAITAGFGLLYAFSGYFVAYYWNVMWLDGMFLLPLVILGIEHLLNGKSAKLYVASLAVAMMSSYYMGYMICIISVIYSLCYYLGKHTIGKRFFILAGRFILYSLLTAGVAALTLLPTAFALRSSSATSGSFPTSVSTYFNIFDFLANHLASLEPTIRSSGDDVLPNIYCGVGTVMLAFLYLYVKSIPLREKVSRAILIIFLFLSFNINYLNYIWHGFHFPNDLPYRFSFAYSFVLLTIAFKALMRIRELMGKDLLNTGIGMCAFIILLEELGSKNVKEDTIIISLIFVVLYTIVFSLLNNRKFQTSSVATLLFCCMFAEVAIADTNNFDIDQPKTAYSSDYTEFRALHKTLDEYEDGKFYRMELTDLRTRMDPCWYGYNGMSTFSSMAYESSANLQYNLGMFGNYINSYTYNLQTPVYNAMFSLKYIVDNSELIELNSDIYTVAAYSEDLEFTAYENKYCLPLAYCVSNNIEDWDTTYNNPFLVQGEYFKLATGMSGVFDTVPITDVTYSNVNEFTDDISSGSYSFYTNGYPASFTLTVIPEKTQNIYIYVKSDNVDSITVRNLDGSFYIDQDVDEEYILDLGVHEKGEQLFVDIPISDGETGYVDAYVAGLNDRVFKEGYEKLKSHCMDISSFSDTEIVGTVTADESCVLYTSINYDDSWKVYVDGKEVDYENDIVKIGDALLGIRLAPGEHEISMKYTARGLYAGFAVSAVSVILLILLLIVIPKRKAAAAARKSTLAATTADSLNTENSSTEGSSAQNSDTENPSNDNLNNN